MLQPSERNKKRTTNRKGKTVNILAFIQDTMGFLYDFLIIGVLGYLAKKWVADRVAEKWNTWKNSTPRTLAIWEHYNHKHDQDEVLDCDQGRCTVFKQYVS